MYTDVIYYSYKNKNCKEMQRLDFRICYSQDYNPDDFRVILCSVDKYDAFLIHSLYQSYRKNEMAKKLFHLYFKMYSKDIAFGYCKHQFFSNNYLLTREHLSMEEYTICETRDALKRDISDCLKDNMCVEISQSDWNILFKYPERIHIARGKDDLPDLFLYKRVQSYDALAANVEYKDNPHGFKGRVCSICGHVFGEKWDNNKLTKDDCEFLQSLIENYGVVEVE